MKNFITGYQKPITDTFNEAHRNGEWEKVYSLINPIPGTVSCGYIEVRVYRKRAGWSAVCWMNGGGTHSATAQNFDDAVSRAVKNAGFQFDQTVHIEALDLMLALNEYFGNNYVVFRANP